MMNLNPDLREKLHKYKSTFLAEYPDRPSAIMISMYRPGPGTLSITEVNCDSDNKTWFSNTHSLSESGFAADDVMNLFAGSNTEPAAIVLIYDCESGSWTDHFYLGESAIEYDNSFENIDNVITVFNPFNPNPGSLNV